MEFGAFLGNEHRYCNMAIGRYYLNIGDESVAVLNIYDYVLLFSF